MGQFLSALGRLGVELVPASDRVVVVRTIDRRASGAVAIHVEEGGAPARFLIALAAIGRRSVTVTGGPRLSARPFAPLIEALRSLGAEVAGGPGLPVTIRGPLHGGIVEADLAAESSQFVSALLLVAPSCAEAVEVRATGAVVSAPYIDLTLDVIRRAGGRVHADGSCWRVEPGFGPAPRDLHADVDWSGAATMLAAAAFLGVPVRVPGLRLASPHPDAAFAELARELGLLVEEDDGGVRCSGRVIRGGVFDLNRTPDLAPVVAALGALTADGVTVLGAPHLRLKESNRIDHLVAVLTEAGVQAEARDDGFVVRGPIAMTEETAKLAIPVDPRGDHRLAMTAALFGLARPVIVRNAQVVSKSFPTFFEVFPAGGHWISEDVRRASSRLTT